MLKKFFAKKPPKRVRIEGSGDDFEVAKNQTILEAALAEGIRYPHDCTVGTCGSCRSRLLSGKVDPITPFGYTLSKEELQDGFILACQAVPESDVVVDVDLEPSIDQTLCQATIAKTEKLTHDILKVTWHTDRPVEFRAGQYMKVNWQGSPGSRSYSFSHAPSEGGSQTVSTFIRKVPGGAFTEKLFSGDFGPEVAFEIDAAHGNFWLREGNGPIVLVGGGSGLSPLMSVLEDALANEVERDAILLFGGRRNEDLYCLDDIARIEKAWKGKFVFWPILSEETVDGLRHGMVTSAIPEALSELGGSNRVEAYMCGPPPMIDAAVAAFSDAGIPLRRIYYDKFTDASTGRK